MDDEGWNRGYDSTDGIHFNLVVKDRNRIDNSGAASIVVDGLARETLVADLSSVGSLEIGDLKANELVVRQSGAETVVVSGR